jgi:hypothetical protein
MQSFVQQENLRRFVEALEHEADPDRRELLQRLLEEEENRYGKRRELIGRIDQFVAAGRVRIDRQRELVARLQADGEDHATAQVVLLNLIETQCFFADFRLRLDGPDGA